MMNLAIFTLIASPFPTYYDTRKNNYSQFFKNIYKKINEIEGIGIRCRNLALHLPKFRTRISSSGYSESKWGI